MSVRGNTQISARVSMRKRITEALSRTNRQRDVAGQVSRATINDCPAGFPSSMYRLRYICCPCPRTSSGTNIIRLAASPWTGSGVANANAAARVAEAVLLSHSRPLVPDSSWRPSGFLKLTFLVSVAVCVYVGWRPLLSHESWDVRGADCTLGQLHPPYQAASFPSAWP